MRGVRVRCPAKLNLFLAVGRRDERGYHPIRTVFQAIDLSDTLILEPAAFASFECNSAAVPEDNTVTKALRLLSEFALLPPLRIRLSKRIPSESGLGGGSSDAAGLIRAINRFLPAPVAERQLHDVAAAVGADVPFFLVGGRALGEGYGERLTPLPDLGEEWFVVLRPPVGCSTREMYGKLDGLDFPWREAALDELYNDFERVMPCDCEDWQERLLANGATGALLTGSGSAVFGRFESRTAAEGAAQRLREEWKKSYVVGGADVPVWVTRSLSRQESLEAEPL